MASELLQRESVEFIKESQRKRVPKQEVVLEVPYSKKCVLFFF